MPSLIEFYFNLDMIVGNSIHVDKWGTEDSTKK